MRISPFATRCANSSAATGSHASSTRKSERTAVEAFYSSRDYAPMFVGTDGATERARQTIAHLRNADADGMDPNDYPVPSIQAGAAPAAMAEAEMRLVESVLDYARHAQMGRVHYSRVSADIFYEQTAPAPLDVLSKLARGQQGGRCARQLSAAAGRLQGAAQEARRRARPQGRRARGDRARPGAGACRPTSAPSRPILMSDERVPALREKLGLAAVRGDNVLRQAARRRGRAVPEGKGPARDRQADAADRRRAQRQAPRERRPDHHRQHGALALDSARSRQGACGAERPGLHAARLQQRRARSGQTRVVVGKPGHADAAPLGDDEVRHRQSDLERAAVDRLQRIPARAAAGPDRAQAHGPEPGSNGRTAACTSRSRRARPTRSAACASISPTSSWSISTTRRTSTCSRTASAPTATAACGCRIRPSTPRS